MFGKEKRKMEPIKVDKSILKKKEGKPTTIEARRRNSEPVRGRKAGKRDHYTEKEKMNAVCVFAVAGNSRRTAEITKIPEATIRAWKQTEWWNELATRIIVEQDEELDTKLTALVDKAVGQVNDRLEKGNYVYNPRLDKLIRKPVDAKELAIVTAISIDKRELLRGKPTSRVEKISQEQRLVGLAAQFKSFVTAKEVKQVEEEIEEEEEVKEEVEEALTINEMFTE
ncbi:MAG: hypothetical protein DDT42_01657 [candidate division WS2 bacterium]|uniref:Terminase n=1 Tax=Psychracetigena formicireducens TaxID=2986056 RepID=A0A9E2BJS8_PSYF1|nr:hypothetical protein [Candidatus Psychracetigena formicireducens]